MHIKVKTAARLEARGEGALRLGANAIANDEPGDYLSFELNHHPRAMLAFALDLLRFAKMAE